MRATVSARVTTRSSVSRPRSCDAKNWCMNDGVTTTSGMVTVMSAPGEGKYASMAHMRRKAAWQFGPMATKKKRNAPITRRQSSEAIKRSRLVSGSKLKKCLLEEVTLGRV